MWLFLGKLQGKVIWITGASSGIGEAMAYEAARNNSKVIISARREDELLRVKNRCLELNSSLANNDVLVLPLDITKHELHKHCFDVIIHQFGKVRLSTFNKILQLRCQAVRLNS